MLAHLALHTDKNARISIIQITHPTPGNKAIIDKTICHVLRLLLSPCLEITTAIIAMDRIPNKSDSGRNIQNRLEPDRGVSFNASAFTKSINTGSNVSNEATAVARHLYFSVFMS